MSDNDNWHCIAWATENELVTDPPSDSHCSVSRLQLALICY